MKLFPKVAELDKRLQALERMVGTGSPQKVVWREGDLLQHPQGGTRVVLLNHVGELTAYRFVDVLERDSTSLLRYYYARELEPRMWIVVRNIFEPSP